jgi:membrane associated rhomboid family serine protease
MEFADWLTSPPSRGHLPPFLWIAIYVCLALAVLMPFVKRSDWIGWLAALIVFGVSIFFMAVVILAVISRVHSNRNKEK